MITFLTIIVTGATVIAAITGIVPGWKLQSSVGGGGSGITTSCAGTFTAPSGFTCAQLTVNWVYNDVLAGGAVSSVTGVFYNPVTLQAADSPSGTSSSAGVLASVNPWTSGTAFICKEKATNYVTAFIPCIVPANPASSSTALTTITAPLPIVKTGTWSLTATLNNGGTAWSSSWSTYSFVVQGTTQVVVSWQLSELNNNQGYLNNFDAVNQRNQMLTIELKSTSTPKTTAVGCEYGTTYNQKTYCQYVLPDGLTTISGAGGYQKTAVSSYFSTSPDGRFPTSQFPAVGSTSYGGVTVSGSASQAFVGNQAYPLGNAGSVYFTTTFGSGSLSASSETWTVTLYTGADVWYFDGIGGAVQGAYGGDQTSQTLSPSWSTITLLN